MKYVVIRTKMGKLFREIPVIFPNDLAHIDVANAIIRGCSEAKGGMPVSAGSINSFEIDAKTHGHSITLNLKSREEDGNLIQMCDYGQHIKD